MFLFSAETQAGEVTGIGGIKFGMSFDEIIKIRGEPKSSHVMKYGLASLYYNDTVIGKQVTTSYETNAYLDPECAEDNLSKCIFTHGKYTFEDHSASFNDRLKSFLTKKYGPPAEVYTEENDITFMAKQPTAPVISIGTNYIRYSGKVKIAHKWKSNKTEYVNKWTGMRPEGPVKLMVNYYGSDYKKETSVHKGFEL